MKPFIWLIVMMSMWPMAAWAASDNDAVAQGHRLLDNWQVEAAGEVARSLEEREADSLRDLFFLGRYYFERGDYPKALDYVNGAGDYLPEAPYEFDYTAYLMAAYENTREFERLQSEHFEVRFRPDKERIIARATLETLERAREAFSHDFGYAPSDRIVVELYPELPMLARATGLTLAQLKTSGTIAICKFNRMMISSPRVGLMGYPWRDTIAHEFSHLIISRVSGNTVPIWLHEGLAKFHEERWRMPPGGQREASGEALLARALKEDKLITLDEMHPSMALLPSQEHAALAYTEVLTMIQWLHRRGGAQGLQKLLAALRKSGDLDDAFQRTYGFDVEGLQRAWKTDVKDWNLRQDAYGFNDYSILFDEGEPPDPEKAIGNIEAIRGRRFVTLGKLLKDRQHHKAAVKEFDKAEPFVQRGDPRLSTLKADSQIELEQYDAAITTLGPVFELAPNWLPSRVRAGEALMKLERYEQALEQLVYAFGINPYDPRIYQLMALCYDKLGDTHLAEKARADLALIAAR